MSDVGDGPASGNGQSPAPPVSGGDAPVSIYSSDQVLFVEPSTTLRTVAAIIAEETVGCVVVGDAEHVAGVVSERDIARLAGMGEDLDALTAAHLTDRSLVWVDEQATIDRVATEMMQGYVRHVLVGDGGRLVGIVSMRDVIAAYTTG